MTKVRLSMLHSEFSIWLYRRSPVYEIPSHIVSALVLRYCGAGLPLYVDSTTKFHVKVLKFAGDLSRWRKCIMLRIPWEVLISLNFRRWNTMKCVSHNGPLTGSQTQPCYSPGFIYVLSIGRCLYSIWCDGSPEFVNLVTSSGWDPSILNIWYTHANWVCNLSFDFKAFLDKFVNSERYPNVGPIFLQTKTPATQIQSLLFLGSGTTNLESLRRIREGNYTSETGVISL